MTIKNVIWDWNGTLLDDVDFCISSINKVLNKRDLPLLTYHMYRDIFTFPIIEYYRLAGFDFEVNNFSQLSIEYIELYEVGKFNCSLFNDAISTLNYLKGEGIKQYILSASKIDSLHEITNHFSLQPYFETLSGLDNIYAHSKLELGYKLIEKISAPLEEILMIGDTLHDLDVAQNLGIKCLLVTRGHQSSQKLSLSGAPILYDFSEIKSHL